MAGSMVAHRKDQSGFDKIAIDSQSTRKVSINVKSERISTVISAGTQVSGDVVLQEGVKLDGDMRGNLTFGVEDGLGIISRSATLEGELRGPRALIMGTVEGDVHIHGLLMLGPSALVIGNVYYDRLVVHDGAQISGAMHMNRSRAIQSSVQGEANMRNTDTAQGVVRTIKAA